MITIVCGPPCAGKTTYVTDHASPDAQVIDFDVIARDLGSSSDWLHAEPFTSLANAEVERQVAELSPASEAWLIRSLPYPWQRQQLAERLDAQVVLVDPGQSECLRRAASQRPSGTKRAIRLWYWKATRDG